MFGIKIDVDAEKVEYPGHNGSSQFKVTATNTSREFAMLQVRVSPKDYPNSQSHHWYTVEPVVTAKKPPGSKTEFTVEIIESPIPGIEETIPLSIRVFSVENSNLYARQEIYLTVSQAHQSIEMDILDVENRSILFPDRENKIPIRIRNLRQHEIEVNLTFKSPEVPEEWDVEFENSKVKIPGNQAKTHFLVLSLPEASETKAGTQHEFAIIAAPEEGEFIQKKGLLVVAPQGSIELSCDRKNQSISDCQKVEHNQYRFEYPIEIKNNTNLHQTVDLSCNEKNLDFNLNPIHLERGTSKTVRAIAKIGKHQRPWLIPKLLDFEVRAKVRSPQDNITLNRNELPLTIKLEPNWWQTLILFFLLLAAFPLYQYFFSKTHQDAVNSVRIVDSGSRVLSGSRDNAIFQWHVNSFPERLINVNSLKYRGEVASPTQTKSGVRVIRERSKSGAREVVVAAGLENGNIQLWTVGTGENTPQWSIASQDSERQDSVFDLQFMRDARYLFSAHGSGWVRQWDLEQIQRENTQPQKKTYLDGIAIYALGITKSQSGNDLLAIGGQFNTLAFWDWEIDRVYRLQPDSSQQIQQSKSEGDFLPIFGKRQYITSIAANDDRLVTADTQGYIKVWNMEELRRCMQSASFSGEFSCSDAALQWQNRQGHGGKPVRSVALVQHRQCYYLASAGDDGQVVLWSFSPQTDKPKQDIIAHFANTRLNAVDLALNSDRHEALIASDGDRNRVRLYHHPMNSHADCQ